MENIINIKDRGFKLTQYLIKLKWLDRIFSAGTNTLLRLFRFLNKNKANTNKKLLILDIHRLGDTVFTIPSLRVLVNKFSDYNIKIACLKNTKDILKLEFENEILMAFDKNDFLFNGRFATKKLRNIIKSYNPEIVIDITGSPASASLIYNIPAKKIIGINLKYFKSLYDKYIPIRKSPHFMDIYMDIVKSIFPDNYTTEIFKFKTKIFKDGKILIHPFAIRNPKEWNLKRYIELTSSLKNDYKVELVTPPGFIPYDVINEINTKNIKINITESIEDLIEKIRECSVFISNDSGPTYIASFLQKPTFTIYGPTNPDYSLPFDKNHRYYRKVLKCSAKTEKNEKFCFTLAGIYCPHNDCMNLMTLQEVETEIRIFLNDLGINKKTVSKKVYN